MSEGSQRKNHASLSAEDTKARITISFCPFSQSASSAFSRVVPFRVLLHRRSHGHNLLRARLALFFFLHHELRVAGCQRKKYPERQLAPRIPFPLTQRSARSPCSSGFTPLLFVERRACSA